MPAPDAADTTESVAVPDSVPPTCDQFALMPEAIPVAPNVIVPLMEIWPSPSEVLFKISLDAQSRHM
jgi:hypothetical protein